MTRGGAWLPAGHQAALPTPTRAYVLPRPLAAIAPVLPRPCPQACQAKGIQADMGLLNVSLQHHRAQPLEEAAAAHIAASVLGQCGGDVHATVQRLVGIAMARISLEGSGGGGGGGGSSMGGGGGGGGGMDGGLPYR